VLVVVSYCLKEEKVGWLGSWFLFFLLELLHLSFGLLDREEVGVLLERGLAKAGLLPKVGSQISVGLTESEEGSLHEVTHGLRASLSLGVHIINT
jgi:hypothetical protein